VDAAGRSVVKAREQADAIDRDLKAIAARAREAEARRAELEKAFKMQARYCLRPRCFLRAQVSMVLFFTWWCNKVWT
jgi:hypothetical protein